jgi:hypothetical protein
LYAPTNLRKLVGVTSQQALKQTTHALQVSCSFFIFFYFFYYIFSSLLIGFFVGEVELKPSPSPLKKARSEEQEQQEGIDLGTESEDFDFEEEEKEEDSEKSGSDSDSDSDDDHSFTTPNISFTLSPPKRKNYSREEEDQDPIVTETDIDILTRRLNKMPTPGGKAKAKKFEEGGKEEEKYMKANHPNIKYMFDDERGQHMLTYEIFLPGGITHQNNIKVHLRESKRGGQTLVIVHPLPTFLFRSDYYYTNCEIRGNGDAITSASRHLARKKAANDIALGYGDGSGSKSNVRAEVTFKLPFRVDNPWDTRNSYVEKYRHTGHTIRSFPYVVMRENANGQNVKVLGNQEVLVVTLVAEKKVESGFNPNATPVRGSLPLMVDGDIDQEGMENANFEVEQLNNHGVGDDSGDL